MYRFSFPKIFTKFEDEIIKGEYDVMCFAGGVKNLDLVLEEVETSKRLHNICELYLINHEECGAYGEESTYENHKRDLLKAKEVIRKKYPDLKIYTYYLHLDGEYGKVE